MTGGIEAFTSGSTLRVDVASIERELTALWKEAAAPVDGAAGAVTRACLLTLVLWEETPEGTRLPPDTLGEVARAHPCRILTAEIDRSASGGSIEASISAYCHRPAAGSRQVCCEQVTLRAPAPAARHLPGLTAALSVPGLPVCLCAPGEPPFGDPVFRRLAAGADRMIVDSARFAGGRSLAAFAGFVASRPETAAGDLNWQRIHPWQDLIAGFFDPPFLRAEIPFIEGSEFTGGEGSETTARLIAGWIRAVLGGRPIRFAWNLDRAAPERALRSVVLRAPGGPTPAIFVVENDLGTGMMVGRVEVEGTCPLPRRVRPRAPSAARLLAAALERSGRDPLFEESLALAGSIP